MMSFGADTGRQLLIVPSLFEELNRTRKLISDLMRALAASDIASHLPDLPGTGESETSLADVTWEAWRHAVTDAAAHVGASAILALRGGCLLDDAVQPAAHIRFSPVAGKRLIRDLLRSRSLTDPAFDSAAQKAVFTGGSTNLGGYPVGAELASALRDAEVIPIDGATTVRLESDHGEADITISGPPLWRRAEPSGSPELAENLAKIVADRIA
ncbi:MAG: hypothetical protein ACTS1Z_12700 [Parasphingopyxis sp.]|uniref:hypothetical protein n=1 Tax=Parasphingopyxis sp. TaxID=1920299 RepID=UPI003F9F6BC7